MQKLKVIVWARDEQDTDYLQRILQGDKGILLCELFEKVDAFVADAELLTRAEKEPNLSRPDDLPTSQQFADNLGLAGDSLSQNFSVLRPTPLSRACPLI